MSFVFSHRAAVDDELGLKLENDLTFRDSMTVTLKLTDLHSGHEWLVPTPTISKSFTYDTPKGPYTSPLNVGVRLNSRLLKPMISDLAQRQRDRGRPTTDAEAKNIFEAALTVFFMRGGEMEKFVPHFRIEWG